MAFKFKQLNIPEVFLITPDKYQDDRGHFVETFKYSEFVKAGIAENFVQDNHSRSHKNVLRGLHYQKNPKVQGKLVYCLRGMITDVCVDIRKSSPTFGKYVAVNLSEENGNMLYIPKGFAHGFLVLSDVADIIYKCTAEYSREHDAGIFWNDPDISINWNVKDPIVSEKDKNNPYLKNAELL